MPSMIPRILFLALIATTAAACATSHRAAAPIPTPASRVTDLTGRPTDPLADAATRRATVLIFITSDCPIANAYAPEIHRLCDAYVKQGIAFYLVYAAPDLAAADARKHYADYAYRCPALLDPDHELARKSGVTVTPEAAVFLPDRQLVYRGRINNLYVDFGKPRFAPTIHDLKDTLQQIATGQTPTPKTTQAIGCYIPM